MLASLTSFLPSSLHPQQHLQDSPKTSQELPIVTPQVEDNHSSKRKEKDRKGANETFIFVRPPPSKTNHPLNLQVQLVPPNARAPSGITPTSSRPSNDSSSSDGATLSRTTSASSAGTAETSGNDSTASFSSVSSTSTNSTTRRTIIPLYNLQAHNVLTNTIVDAGTDAKIAKFQKRGIELIDLAILEPIEVWGDSITGVIPRDDVHSPLARPQRTSTLLQPGHGGPGGTNSRPLTPEQTPTSSAVSLSSASHSPHPQQLSGAHNLPQNQESIGSASTSAAVATSSTAPKRNIFGKLFKKSGAKEPSSPSFPSFSITATSPVSSVFSNMGKHSRTPSIPTTATATPSTSTSIPSTPDTPRPNSSHRTSGNNGTISPLSTPVQRRSFSPLPPKRSSISDIPAPHGPEALAVSNASAFSATPSSAPQQPMLRPPVLGIQPSMSYPLPHPPPKRARALMYVWVIRRWLKRPGPPSNGNHGVGGMVEGMFGSAKGRGMGMVGGLLGNGGVLGAETRVEVRFEWKRGKGKDRDDKEGVVDGEEGKKKSKRRGTAVESPDLVDGDKEREVVKERKRAHRMSTSSHRSTNSLHSAGGLSSDAGHKQEDERDDGEESDAEDSETPWTCTVKLRRIGVQPTNTNHNHFLSPSTSSLTPSHVSSTIAPHTPEQTVRVKVGTLSPTPHHPKVVAMLKIPFPLPDVEVEKMGVKRRGGGNGSGGSFGAGQASSLDQGMILTAEEIKDIVCSTGLWLVVREGFGGVGKVSRKGDGWRIRA